MAYMKDLKKIRWYWRSGSCKIVNTTEETREYYMNTLSLKGIKELSNRVTIDYDMIPDYKNGVPELDDLYDECAVCNRR